MTILPSYPENMRSMFVALVGAPNVGKSTLVNQLTGEKISIVSPKVQTTRMRVRGVVTEGEAQLVLVDTPGIFLPKRRLEEAIVQEAWRGFEENDAIAVLVDAAKGICSDTRRVLESLEQQNRKAILILNKTDTVDPAKLLPLSKQLYDMGVFSDVFMVSALTGEGVADVKKHLLAKAPEGQWMYPPDQASDLPLRLFLSEITRESLFLSLQQELPYSLAVETEKVEEQKNGDLKVNQLIYVNKDAHKQIVLGKGGARIREIGSSSRRQLEKLLGQKVHLFLFVKVKPDWQERREIYTSTGMEFPQ